MTSRKKETCLATQQYQFYRATILNPLSDKACQYWPDGVLVVRNEKIQEVLAYREACAKYLDHFTKKNLHEYPGQVLMPAFFDMHFHWVQDDVRLMPKASLLEWLEKYTFPTEARYANKTYARKKAKIFFKRLARVGTLGGACYSSIHDHALDYAMHEVVGDVLVGNVLMTMQSPASLTQKTQEAIQAAQRGMRKYGKRYILTPRFAVATDPVAMQKTAVEADRRGVFKQSHLSESPSEISFVMQLYRAMPGFEGVKNYTEIYQRARMLGPRALMAHAIHLKPVEWRLLARTRTALIHCPTSNAPLKECGLGSGLFDYRRAEKYKLRWALGSDIGGGPFLSMLDVMHSFVKQHGKAGRKDATHVKALFRSTLAGARILGVDKRAGNLQRGKEANFILVQGPRKPFADAETCLKKLLGQVKKRSAYDGQVSATFYRGQQLKT